MTDGAFSDDGAFHPLETWDADAIMKLFRERLLARLIERHETDRLARLREIPGEFERLLPYAVAFGFEKDWGGASADANAIGKPSERYTAPASAAGASVDTRSSVGLLVPIVVMSLAVTPVRGRRAFRP